VDYSRGEFDPGAIIPETGIGADGAEDGVGGDGGGLNLLDKDIEDGADVLVAAGFEAEGVRVAVDDRPVRQVVVFDDVVGAMPIEEIVFDLGALRVVTDMALTGVALRSALGRRSLRRPVILSIFMFVPSFSSSFLGARKICPDLR
jgi:hypothetical protein